MFRLEMIASAVTDSPAMQVLMMWLMKYSILPSAIFSETELEGKNLLTAARGVGHFSADGSVPALVLKKDGVIVYAIGKPVGGNVIFISKVMKGEQGLFIPRPRQVSRPRAISFNNARPRQ
jgi:hypothetical protein